jgi:hypothetical protein
MIVEKTRLSKTYLKLEQNAPFILLLFIGILICIIAWFNQMWEGGGDNYWHYYFSKYAYTYPKFFLHHWGKPLFILLSSPFAQFGFYGINLFNIICGLLSAWIAFKFCTALGFNMAWVAIPLVLGAPVYFLVIQSAMTEPLFGLILIFSSYLFFKEKYLWGALVASTLIYSRSEGMFILIIYAFFLLLSRKWKYIPFLASAFIIYSLAGYFSGHDFLWYFTENPYKEESVYGHGTWDHFLKKYRVILGLPHTILFIAGSILLLFNIIKKKELNVLASLSGNTKIFILVFIPAMAYSFFHVYAWALGKYASAGLDRVFTAIVPFTSVIGMYAIDLIGSAKLNMYIKKAFSVLLVVFIAYETTSYFKYPLKAYGAEKAERKAAKWFKKVRDPKKTIYYCHPALAFFCDFDPFDTHLNKGCYEFPGNCAQNEKESFYYVWDSDGSEFYCHHKLEDLKNCPNLKLIRMFQDGDLFKLYFFEFTPSK